MANNMLLLFALCVLPAIATVHGLSAHHQTPLLVVGKAYCDTCRCGFENEATKYLAGAVVQIECRSRKTSEITYQKHGVTDSTGTYRIPVGGDRGDDRCDVLLVKSSDPECSNPNSGRDRARVILTRNNGMNSNIRFANAMGFLKNVPLTSCAEVLQKYQDTEDDI